MSGGNLTGFFQRLTFLFLFPNKNIKYQNELPQFQRREAQVSFYIKSEPSILELSL